MFPEWLQAARATLSNLDQDQEICNLRAEGPEALPRFELAYQQVVQKCACLELEVDVERLLASLRSAPQPSIRRLSAADTAEGRGAEERVRGLMARAQRLSGAPPAGELRARLRAVRAEVTWRRLAAEVAEADPLASPIHMDQVEERRKLTQTVLRELQEELEGGGLGPWQTDAEAGAARLEAGAASLAGAAALVADLAADLALVAELTGAVRAAADLKSLEGEDPPLVLAESSGLAERRRQVEAEVQLEGLEELIEQRQVAARDWALLRELQVAAPTDDMGRLERALEAVEATGRHAGAELVREAAVRLETLKAEWAAFRQARGADLSAPSEAAPAVQFPRPAAPGKWIPAGKRIWYNEERILGQGSLGTYVFEGVYMKTSRESRTAAVKVIRQPPGEQGEDMLNLVEREVELLQDLNSHTKRITQLFTWTHDPAAKCIVLAMELCECSLGNWIDRAWEAAIPYWEERLRMCRETAAAVEDVHEADVSHNDVKVDNVLLTGDTPPQVNLSADDMSDINLHDVVDTNRQRVSNNKYPKP
jgi:hypothetical protein